MFDLFLAALATFRISKALTLEQGPFDILLNMRSFLGKKAAINPVWKTIADLFYCPYCLGIWIASFLLLLRKNSVTKFCIKLFAIAGVQSLLQSVEDKLHPIE